MNSDSQLLIDNIGSRLKALRTQRNLTLKELAEASGVSVGMISQIERNLSSPSIRILERLRQAMNIPLMELLDSTISQEEPQNTVVRREKDRPIVNLKGGDIVKQLLSPIGDHDIQFMKIKINRGTKHEDVLMGPGEKAGMIISGRVSLEVDRNIYILNAGDSFQFLGKLQHSIENIGQKDVELIWIMNTRFPKDAM